MPNSKVHKRRKEKLKKKQVKLEKWVGRKVKAFNDLPEEDKQAMLRTWGFGSKKQEKEEEDATSGETA